MMLTCAGKTLWGVCQGGNRLGKQAEILADLRKWSRKTGPVKTPHLKSR